MPYRLPPPSPAAQQAGTTVHPLQRSTGAQGGESTCLSGAATGGGQAQQASVAQKAVHFGDCSVDVSLGL